MDKDKCLLLRKCDLIQHYVFMTTWTMIILCMDMKLLIKIHIPLCYHCYGLLLSWTWNKKVINNTENGYGVIERVYNKIVGIDDSTVTEMVMEIGEIIMTHLLYWLTTSYQKTS
eukprot:41762_1